MCGVSAAVVRPERLAEGRAFVEGAVQALRVRGPDAEGTRGFEWSDWRLVLGHNRLSIIDLSPLGNQPMAAGADGPVIAYNGEIYNYRELRMELEAGGARFRSESDTEVLLAAWSRWGASALERCNGMFAFVLVDPRAGEVVLARDRFGVKPLHFVRRADSLLVASTPGPLEPHAGGPDVGYVLRGLARGIYDEGDEAAPFRDVITVRPGHLYRFRLGPGPIEQRVERYYDFAARVELRVADPKHTADQDRIAELGALFSDAAALRMRSDVPVAVSLSGGLDSGMVASHAAAAGTIAGIAFASPDVPSTEGPAVASTARMIGLPVEYVFPTPAAMAGLFWECLEAQQAPFLTGSVAAQFAVFRQARELGYKVLLGGQGGDEGCMGYRKYQMFAAQAAWRTGRDIPEALTSLAQVAWAERRQLATYGRSALRYLGIGRASSLFDLSAAPDEPTGLGAGGLLERQILDVTRWSLPTLLRYEDRNSAGNSTESRLPFLDFRVLEAAVALPLHLKLRDGYGKWALRSLADSRLPRSLVWNRAKRGFDVTVGSWIRAGLGAAFRDRIRGAGAGLRPLLRAPLSLKRDFSDDILVRSPSRFADAITAAWLSTRL